MNNKLSLLFVFGLVGLLIVHSAQAAPKPDLKALLVTGGCCHDYESQRDIIPEVVDKHSKLNIQWTVVHQRSKKTDTLLEFYKNPHWADGYDVIVHNECFANVGDEEYVTGILQPHRDGVPAVIVHCTMHSYRTGKKAVDWWEFCGVHSPGHGPKHPFEVEILASDHEIMKGMDNWKTPKGELYFIKQSFPTMTALAESKSEKDGKKHATIWTNVYGAKKTRVFATTIGHHNETMLEANYQQMLTRGLLWAVGKPVAENLKSSTQ
jgi:type 1 glutamine amidotransferase